MPVTARPGSQYRAHEGPDEQHPVPTTGVVSEGDPAREHEPGQPFDDTRSPLTAPLRAALVAAWLSVLLQTAGPALGVVEGAEPAFTSWPLLAAVGALPVMAATWYATGGQTAAAAGLLGALAVLAPGRALSDLQIVVDTAVTARPELLVPTTLEPLPASGGAVALLASHLATLLAGVLAALGATSRDRAVPGADAVGTPDGRADELPGTRRQGLLALALCAGVLASAGLLQAPFHSDDPYLWPQMFLDAPMLVAFGAMLTALAVPLLAALAAGSAEPATARGGLLGVAFGVVALALPPVVAALATPTLDVSLGPVLAVVAAGALLGLAVPAGRTEGPAVSDTPPGTAEVVLPEQNRLHTVAAVLGLLTAVAAVLGAVLPQLEVPENATRPPAYAFRVLLLAGLVVGGLAATLLAQRVAATVRPAFVVAWTAVPMAGVGALDVAITASDLPGVDTGPGTWAAGAALALALAAGCCAALAGGVERDEIDLTALAVDRRLAALSVVQALLALAAFGLPLATSETYTAPGLWVGFRTASWGLACGLVAVLAAAALAPRSRPVRAVPLLLGAAVVLLVRLGELPLTVGRAADLRPGPGAWAAVLCLVALLAGAALAATGARRMSQDAPRGVG